MRDGMLGISLREFLGPIMDFFTKLLSKDGVLWWGEFKLFLRKRSTWTQHLLRTLGTFSIPASIDFDFKKEFRLRENGGTYTSIGQNFIDWFLSGVGEIQEHVGESKLDSTPISEPCLPTRVIAALDGEHNVEIMLSELAYIMKIFINLGTSDDNQGCVFIRDFKGILRCVILVSYCSKKSVEAYALGDRVVLEAGTRVLHRSHNSQFRPTALSDV